MTIASVVLDVSIGKALDYAIPEELQNKVLVGSLVKVPLNRQTKHGAVIEIKSESSFAALKPITALINESHPLPSDLLNLSFWISKHYCTSWETVLKTMIPSSIRGKSKAKEQYFVTRLKSREELKEACIHLRQKCPKQAEILDMMLQASKGIFLSELIRKNGCRPAISSLVKKGFLKMEKVFIDRSPLQEADFFPTKAKELHEEQRKALEDIKQSIDAGKFMTHLLWGITGSGKTEVYLQAIDYALKKNKTALMLVPEISLTSQTIERFKSRFTNQIAILHCRLSQGERFDEWMKIARGEASIVIGARSAIFSPLPNLGLIIVDEEHDLSYKSENMPSYHARDVAVMRGDFAKAAVILGSATPSIETFFNCEKGKYTLNVLKNRALQSQLPAVEIVDMKHEWDKVKGFTLFSEKLLSQIDCNMKKGEQTILFLNRRGYHTSLFCPSCGESILCTACDVALTYHYKDNMLSCHLCGYNQTPPPKTCPSCFSAEPMKYKGVGTEQVERALHAIFPGIRTSRLDRDTTKHKGSHQKIFREFKTGKADVLIGTQMVAKGLHFPEVTLVGVLNCDSSLSIPDFRASENTFQLITQVAGRSGRGSLPGKVILQTLIPENSTIRHASLQDYEGFYKEELEIRKIFGYPPFSQLVKIRHSTADESKTKKELETFRLKLIQSLPPEYEISPVIPSGHAKIKNAYRFQFIIRGPKISLISKTLQTLNANKFSIDINPASTFF